MLVDGVHVTTETELEQVKVHERRSGERTHGLPPPFNVVPVSSLCPTARDASFSRTSIDSDRLCKSYFLCSLAAVCS
jgi:hypothetical protein